MEAVSSADFSPEVLACLPQDLPWSISPQDRTYRRDFTGIRYLPSPILLPIALPSAFHVAHPLFALLIFLLAVLAHAPCSPNVPFLYP